MGARLVAPVGFLVALAALFFVLQTLNNPPTSSIATTASPDILKQFEIKPVAPIAATVTDKNNQKVDLISLLTKPTLLTFWSVGCGECETGLPLLDTFAKSQSKIAIVIVDTKDSPKDAQAKLDSLKVSLTTYYDPDGSAYQNWEATMPSSYYVAAGQIKYFFNGRVANDHLQALLTITP